MSNEENGSTTTSTSSLPISQPPKKRVFLTLVADFRADQLLKDWRDLEYWLNRMVRNSLSSLAEVPSGDFVEKRVLPSGGEAYLKVLLSSVPPNVSPPFTPQSL